jgi:hypothetical protein
MLTLSTNTMCTLCKSGLEHLESLSAHNTLFLNMVITTVEFTVLSPKLIAAFSVDAQATYAFLNYFGIDRTCYTFPSKSSV